MKGIFIPAEDLSYKIPDIEQWLSEFAGKQFKESFHAFDNGFLRFEKSDCDFVVMADMDGISYLFKNHNKAMLFKLTWC